MKESVDPAIVKAQNIAKWLFIINLAPAVLAGAVIIMSFADLVINHFVNRLDWLLLIVLLPGMTAEFIYYQQMRDTDHVLNHSGWIYSIVINALCIIGYTVGLLYSFSWGELIVVYPLAFLWLSAKGLRLIKRYEALKTQ